MTGTVQPTFSNTNGDQQGVSATTPFPVTSSGTGTGADQVQGNVASGVADAGNPVKVGAVATDSSVILPAVTPGNRTNLLTTSRGALAVAIYGGGGFAADTNNQAADGLATSFIGISTVSYGRVFNGTTWDRQRGDTNGTNMQLAATASRWQYAAASGGIVNTTTAVTLAAAAGASIRNYLASLEISADTLGAATEIAIRDGAAGTVLWRGKIQTTGLALMHITFPVPLKGTANTLLEFVTLTASVTGAVYVNAQGFTGA